MSADPQKRGWRNRFVGGSLSEARTGMDDRLIDESSRQPRQADKRDLPSQKCWAELGADERTKCNRSAIPYRNERQ